MRNTCLAVDEVQISVPDSSCHSCVVYPFNRHALTPDNPVPLSRFFICRKKRDVVSSLATLVVAWLTELASQWELQPDKTEIHMSFPDKKVRSTTLFFFS